MTESAPPPPAAEPAAALDSSDPYAREAQTFPKLTAEQVARASAFGIVEDLAQGTVLFQRGDRTVDFFLVHSGHVEIYEDGPDGTPNVFTIHAANQFTGELDLFNDRDILVGGRMGEGGRVARLNRAQFRRLLAAEPDIAETVMRAFILRRVGLITHAQGAVTLVAGRGSGDALRLQRFLGRNGYPVRVLDPDRDAEAATLLRQHAHDAAAPLVLCPPDRVLRNPSNRELAECLGIAEPIDPETTFDLAVVGAGPAGLAAAVYGASEGLRTVVLESEAPGGQAGTSSKIENYLGFPTGISGQALAGRAQVQAQKFGARIAVPRTATALKRDDDGCCTLTLDDGGSLRARSVVLATGARYRRLDHLEDYARFEGNGIHYAATAVEAGLCEREEVVVVGGGNSAGQAAVFLARHAARVHMLVRGDGLAASMSDYLVGRIDASDRIALYTGAEVSAVRGDRHLERVRWRDRKSGEETEVASANLFLMLGAVPNTEWLRGSGVRLDENGFACVGGRAEDRGAFVLETTLPGVFAVGDVRAGSVKRVASSVGEGSVVVSSVHQWLAAGG